MLAEKIVHALFAGHGSVKNFIEVGNETQEYFVKRLESEIVSNVKGTLKVDKVLLIDIKGKQAIKQCRFKLNTPINAGKACI